MLGAKKKYLKHVTLSMPSFTATTVRLNATIMAVTGHGQRAQTVGLNSHQTFTVG